MSTCITGNHNKKVSNMMVQCFVRLHYTYMYETTFDYGEFYIV